MFFVLVRTLDFTFDQKRSLNIRIQRVSKTQGHRCSHISGTYRFQGSLETKKSSLPFLSSLFARWLHPYTEFLCLLLHSMESENCHL